MYLIITICRSTNSTPVQNLEIRLIQCYPGLFQQVPDRPVLLIGIKGCKQISCKEKVPENLILFRDFIVHFSSVPVLRRQDPQQAQYDGGVQGHHGK